MMNMTNLNRRSLALVGAICGDIIGSAYERRGVKTTHFPLFTERSRFTDDTVCTIAIADALINNMPLAQNLQQDIKDVIMQLNDYTQDGRKYVLS